MPDTRSINYTREAFLHPLNIGFLMAISILAMFFSATPWMPTLLITIGLGLELVYLGTVPWKPWFRDLMEMRYREEENREDLEKVQFGQLDVKHQKQFLALKRIYGGVEANFERLPRSTNMLTQPLISRLNALISEYLQLLVLQEQFYAYLSNASTDSLIIEIRNLENEMASVQVEKLYEVKKRRLDILNKRLEKLKATEEKAELCHSRQQTIEDAIRYIYEKTLTMYYPDDFDNQMDEMMSELEDTSDYIRQMEDDAALLSRYDRYMNA